MKLFWMSFANPDREKGQQFLGVILIEADIAKNALWKTWRLKLNPGGEVQFTTFEEGEYTVKLIPLVYRNRLLNRTEVEQLIKHMRTQTSVVMSFDEKGTKMELTPEQKAELEILQTANEKGKFACAVGASFPTLESQTALENLQSKKWITLIDISPITFSKHRERLYRIFLLSQEALDWIKSVSN